MNKLNIRNDVDDRDLNPTRLEQINVKTYTFDHYPLKIWQELFDGGTSGVRYPVTFSKFVGVRYIEYNNGWWAKTNPYMPDYFFHELQENLREELDEIWSDYKQFTQKRHFDDDEI